MGAREPVDEDVVDGLVEGEVESELVSLCVARQVHLLLRLHHLRPNRNLTTVQKEGTPTEECAELSHRDEQPSTCANAARVRTCTMYKSATPTTSTSPSLAGRFRTATCAFWKKRHAVNEFEST